MTQTTINMFKQFGQNMVNQDCLPLKEFEEAMALLSKSQKSRRRNADKKND